MSITLSSISNRVTGMDFIGLVVNKRHLPPIHCSRRAGCWDKTLGPLTLRFDMRKWQFIELTWNLCFLSSIRFDSGPGLIPGSWIMMRHVSCILLLEWSTTSQRLWVYRISVPYAQKDPRFLFEKRRGQPWESGLLSQQ